MDVLCDAGDREVVEAALLAAGAQPVSEAAGEIVRVEHGRPRYGVDLDDSVIPQEAGLNERAVSFTKGCYVGQETVARLHYRGKPNRHLRGLRLSEALAGGEQLHVGERAVGRVSQRRALAGARPDRTGARSPGGRARRAGGGGRAGCDGHGRRAAVRLRRVIADHPPV